MGIAKRKAVNKTRNKLTGLALVRLEVKVRKSDATLLRCVVRALNDSTLRTQTRAILKEKFEAHSGNYLKALLASAPLEDIDLIRDRSIDRVDRYLSERTGGGINLIDHWDAIAAKLKP